MDAKTSRNLVRRLVRACMRAHEKGATINWDGVNIHSVNGKAQLYPSSFSGKTRVCALSAVV